MFRKAQEIWKNFDQEVLSKDQPDETYNKHGKAEFGDKTFDFKGQRQILQNLENIYKKLTEFMLNLFQG